jgi:hypothetical protein
MCLLTEEEMTHQDTAVLNLYRETAQMKPKLHYFQTFYEYCEDGSSIISNEQHQLHLTTSSRHA